MFCLHFSLNYNYIGVDFALKVINWDPDTLIRLQLWDIAGRSLVITSRVGGGGGVEGSPLQ